MPIVVDTEEKYPAFDKIPRLNREFWITEKIDGTNGLIQIRELEPGDYTPSGNGEYAIQPGERVVAPSSPDGTAYGVRAGSRNKWLTVYEDNFGFAEWVHENALTLAVDLGKGRHYGEFYGRGIQRTYGLDGRRFALFNAKRWHETEFTTPKLEVAPVVSVATHSLSFEAHVAVESLREFGSLAVDGWPDPEGVVIYHTAAKQSFKVTLHNDDGGKAQAASAQGVVQKLAEQAVKPHLYVPGDDWLDVPVGAI